MLSQIEKICKIQFGIHRTTESFREKWKTLQGESATPGRGICRSRRLLKLHKHSMQLNSFKTLVLNGIYLQGRSSMLLQQNLCRMSDFKFMYIDVESNKKAAVGDSITVELGNEADEIINDNNRRVCAVQGMREMEGNWETKKSVMRISKCA